MFHRVIGACLLAIALTGCAAGPIVFGASTGTVNGHLQLRACGGAYRPEQTECPARPMADIEDLRMQVLLGRLSELPIDTLKIDRSFTARLPADRKGCTLVSTIIGLAHAFDMTTVAEGVETQAQLDYLIHEGCDESQGYLHSRPVSKAEFERSLGFNAGTRASRIRRA